jgi:hypothetical protein
MVMLEILAFTLLGRPERSLQIKGMIGQAAATDPCDILIGFRRSKANAKFGNSEARCSASRSPQTNTGAASPAPAPASGTQKQLDMKD